MLYPTLSERTLKVTKRQVVFRADRLIEMRKLRDLTQEALQEIMGVGQTQISRYETGVADPSLAVVKKMAQALDCPVDYLIGLTDDPEEGQRRDGRLTMKQKLLLARYESGELEELALDILQEDVERKSSTPKRASTNGAE